MSARKAAAGDGPYPLPDGWRWVKLGEVLTQQTETEKITDTANEMFMTVKLYGGGAVRRSIKTGTTPRPFTGYRVRSGQFVYSRIDARNGAFAIVPEELDGAVVSKDFPVFELDRGKVDKGYWNHFTKNPMLAVQIKEKLAFGATNRQRVKEDSFLALQLPLPLLSEQRRIANILDRVDWFSAKFFNECKSLTLLVEAALTEFCLKVPMKKYLGGEIFQNVRNGISPSSKGKIPGEVLTLSAITGGGFRPEFRKAAVFESELSPEKTVLKGDLLICRGNGNIELVGRGVLADRSMEKTSFPDTVISATMDLGICRPEFLEICWSTPAVRSQIESSCRTTNGTFKINQKAVRSVAVSLPSVEDQDVFCEYLGIIRSLHSSAMRRGNLGKDLYESLQSRAFRGKL